MIQVDISNIWGQVALPDLLGIEKEISAAHMALTQGKEFLGWGTLPADRPTEQMLRIQGAAEKIRGNSDVLVVTGMGGGCVGAQAVIELLQGANRNLGKGKGDPMVLFAGNNLSSYAWQRLQKALEGKDFSLVMVSKSGEVPQSAIAARALRWMLERKYGSENARKRTWAITDPEEGALRQMAREAGWETFDIPADIGEDFGLLTAAGLLPMAAAGLDIRELMVGAWEASVEYDLRSFENPVWLYAGVRNLLHRKGKDVEILESFEPDFQLFGAWWRQLFAGAGLLPVYAQLGAEARGNLLETMVRFAPPAQPVPVTPDVKNLDGLGCLEGKTLDFVQEQALLAALQTHTDAGVPVMTLETDALCEHTLGQLIWFFQLACGISRYVTEGAKG